MLQRNTMAREEINIGGQANDGTGDSVREAFDKVNSNFTEIYAAGIGPVDLGPLENRVSETENDINLLKNRTSETETDIESIDVRVTDTETAINTLTGSIPGELAGLLSQVYPVGSIYTNASNDANPSTLFGFGTWVSFGTGRVMMGLDAANPLFDTAEETGGTTTTSQAAGSYTVGQQELSVPRDGWGIVGGPLGSAVQGRLLVGSGEGEYREGLESIRAAGSDIVTYHSHELTGGSHTHTLVPPYIVVRMWKRTA